MKFDEILPLLKDGKKAKTQYDSDDEYYESGYFHCGKSDYIVMIIVKKIKEELILPIVNNFSFVEEKQLNSNTWEIIE